MWLKNTDATSYKLFKTYDICASSGDLGPKRQEGDGQVPEGFYTIDLFNPTSNYYLSMRVSYPNTSDVILKTSKNAGGAIIPDYALENLLRAETSSKQNALPLFLLHHSGYYASVKKVSVLLSFQLSLRFLMHNLGL